MDHKYAGLTEDVIDWTAFESALAETEAQPKKPRTTKERTEARTEAAREAERKDRQLTADAIVEEAKAQAGERVTTAIAKLNGTPTPRTPDITDVLRELQALRGDVRDLTNLVLKKGSRS